MGFILIILVLCRFRAIGMLRETIWLAKGVSRSRRISFLVCNNPVEFFLFASSLMARYLAWIAETGIGEQRDAVKAKEAEQSLRQKTRERVQPKMGKIDIDYQKLHDAFFKYQGKPSMSKFGEA